MQDNFQDTGNKQRKRELKENTTLNQGKTSKSKWQCKYIYL